MKLTSVTIKNFQCFGPVATTIDLSKLTTFIGANSCGKTAVLQALARMFGVTRSDRTLRHNDFHVPSGNSLSEFATISLLVEVRIDFPELDNESTTVAAIPECFNQLLLDAEGATPFCRIRLEGTWTRTNLPDGDVEEQLSWITTPNPVVSDADKRRMLAHERSLIHVVYVPAVRDPKKQITQASGSVLGRLLHAVNWSDTVQAEVKEATESVVDSFRSELGVQAVESTLAKSWQQFQDFPTHSAVTLQPIRNDFSELLQQIEVLFGPGNSKTSISIDNLSDGLRSLFYFALITAGFEVEDEFGRESIDTNGTGIPKPLFAAEHLAPPELVVFAIEEPENHLAPHYLGRVFDCFNSIAGKSTAQVIFTSHSPSILGRVDPECVRYLRMHPDDRTTIVRNITLPKGQAEAYKYVKEAVRAHPELYFARLVVLGEGDSEELVIPRIATACGIAIDPSFISIVPLGGRFVNHFWKLLNDLSITHVTLLDLDRERDGGGWGRIQYALQMLEQVGYPRDSLFSVTGNGGQLKTLTAAEVNEMHNWALQPIAGLDPWLARLESFGVLFSSPLDIDFMMYNAFPAEYQSTGKRGPRIPAAPSPEFDKRLSDALSATLKEHNSGGSSYSVEERFSFIWYSYLFLGKGKPSTHLLALNKLSDDDLKSKAPAVLLRLVDSIRQRLGLPKERGDA